MLFPKFIPKEKIYLLYAGVSPRTDDWLARPSTMPLNVARSPRDVPRAVWGHGLGSMPGAKVTRYVHLQRDVHKALEGEK